MSDLAWRLAVDVPLHVDRAFRERLFDAVCAAVDAVEPDDRDGWDVFVHAGPVDADA